MTGGKGSRDAGEGMKPETFNGSSGHMETTYSSQLCHSSFSHVGVLCTFRDPNTPSNWQDRSGGATSGGPACLLVPASSSLAKGAEERKQKPLLCRLAIQLLGLSYFSRSLPLPLSIRILSLFLSCRARCFLGWALPPPSVKCQSSHQMSSSASHPR